jgi:hypothetical protein
MTHPMYSKENPINELVGYDSERRLYPIPYLEDLQKEMWQMIENTRTNSIKKPTWENRRVPIYDNNQHVLYGEINISDTICKDILNGLQKIENEMLKDFRTELSRLPLQIYRNEQSIPHPANLNHCQITRKIHTIQQYYAHLNKVLIPEKLKMEEIEKKKNEEILLQKQKYEEEAETRREQENVRLAEMKLKKLHEELERQKKEKAEKEYVESLYTKYIVLFGNNFERVRYFVNEKVGKHTEYHNVIRPNPIRIPLRPNKAIPKPSYSIREKRISVDDYYTYEERTDDYTLNSRTMKLLEDELKAHFGTVTKREYIALGVWDTRSVLSPKGEEIYNDIIDKAFQIHSKALEEAKLNRLAEIEARKRLEVEDMETRVKNTMNKIKNDLTK